MPLPSFEPRLPSQTKAKLSALKQRDFKSFDDIVDHCCYAWNTLIDQPWKSMSIADATGQQSVTQSDHWY
jgi:hypothetical protein